MQKLVVEVFTFCGQSAYRWLLVCQTYTPAALYSRKDFPVLIFVVFLRAKARLGGEKIKKSPHRNPNPQPYNFYESTSSIHATACAMH
jgi:hypothetical protein